MIKNCYQYLYFQLLTAPRTTIRSPVDTLIRETKGKNQVNMKITAGLVMAEKLGDIKKTS